MGEMVSDPNWWALLSIGCGLFVVGMALGALVGAALVYDRTYPRLVIDDAEYKEARNGPV